MFNEEFVQIIREGGIGVIPTDTIYGVVGSSLNKGAVIRIEQLKQREPDKPFINLISGYGELRRFGVSDFEIERARTYWPGSTSIILSVDAKKFSYLRPLGKTLAFRAPDDHNLVEFLKKTGPLVAPSANLPGDQPATNVDQARSCFGDKVDFYVDGGEQISEPSRLIMLNEEGKEVVIRG